MADEISLPHSAAGHHDDNPHVQENASTIHGNFLALLHFHAHAGDDILKGHLDHVKGNTRYTMTAPYSSSSG